MAGLLACLWLAGCGEQAPVFKYEDILTSNGIITFPGISWGMTPEEVKEALHLTEDNIVEDTSDVTENPIFTYTSYGFLTDTITIDTMDCSLACFFSGYSFFDDDPEAAKLQLTEVTVRLPDEADMAAIETALTEVLGEPSSVNTSMALKTWDRGSRLDYVNEEWLELQRMLYRKSTPWDAPELEEATVMQDTPVTRLKLIDKSEHVIARSIFPGQKGIAFYSNMPEILTYNALAEREEYRQYVYEQPETA